jgi:hypothetical protein
MYLHKNPSSSNQPLHYLLTYCSQWEMYTCSKFKVVLAMNINNYGLLGCGTVTVGYQCFRGIFCIYLQC